MGYSTATNNFIRQWENEIKVLVTVIKKSECWRYSLDLAIRIGCVK